MSSSSVAVGQAIGAVKFDVLRIEDGLIAEITTFGAELFAAFGLGETL